MKKFLILLLLPVFAKSQIISGDVGMATNFTPRFSFAPNLYVQHHLKKDYIGMGVIFDPARQRETYVARYGTYLNKRFYFNSGIGFVNDYSKVQDNANRTFRTYLIGVDYIWKKKTPDQLFNFYSGFDFTDEIVYLKFGVKFGHEKRK